MHIFFHNTFSILCHIIHILRISYYIVHDRDEIWYAPHDYWTSAVTNGDIVYP